MHRINWSSQYTFVWVWCWHWEEKYLWCSMLITLFCLITVMICKTAYLSYIIGVLTITRLVMYVKVILSNSDRSHLNDQVMILRVGIWILLLAIIVLIWALLYITAFFNVFLQNQSVRVSKTMVCSSVNLLVAFSMASIKETIWFTIF